MFENGGSPSSCGNVHLMEHNVDNFLNLTMRPEQFETETTFDFFQGTFG